MLIYSFVFLFCVTITNGILYDTYTGNIVSKAKEEKPDKISALFNLNVCTIDIEPCNLTERRRIDGSCNNLKNPQCGAIFTPPYRVLPPVYSTGFENRRSQCGCDEELKAARVIRYETLLEGKATSTKFTQLSIYFLLFLSSDVGSTLDIVNYVKFRPYCCEEKGKDDDMCAPNLIGNDDPVHRFSDIRCMNLTRPYTFQYFGCASKNTIPTRMVPSTPHLDLSNIYDFKHGTLKNVRDYKSGRLKVVVENDLTYPLKSDGHMCALNKEPVETLCHKYLSNGVIGPNLVMIWVYRYHNYIATKLGEVNPHWNDDQLFYTSREILIAGVLQIYFYQLLPTLFGKKNLIRDGVISKCKGYRDIYDEELNPQVSDEHNYILRFFHIAQETDLQLYSANYTCLETVPMVNLTSRTGFIGVDDHEAKMARGSYMQPTAKFTDYIVDPDIAEVGLGGEQRAFDITTADLAKGRLLGFAPYVDYLEVCRMKKFQTFEDLLEVMDEDNIVRLKRVYKCAKDIDLMSGLWLEKPIEGGSVPSTLYCLMVDQFLRSIKSDRHWYERPNRPYAFTLEQLKQIRNSNMAKMMCSVAPGISKITKNPFRRHSERNRLVNCDELPEIDFDAWRDRET